MVKMTSKGGKKASASYKTVARSSTTGQFVLGRAAFDSISRVEGIILTKDMRTDFKRTEGMSADKRRATLAAKYGKNKKK